MHPTIATHLTDGEAAANMQQGFIRNGTTHGPDSANTRNPRAFYQLKSRSAAALLGERETYNNAMPTMRTVRIDQLTKNQDVVDG